jgi:hypothetical protein
MAATLKVDPVKTALHVVPAHTSHASVTEVGAFVQLPGTTLRTCPCWATPEIAGGEMLTGAAGSTAAVGADDADAVWAGVTELSVAVSTTTMDCPTSVALGV